MIFPKRENFKVSDKPLIIVGSKNPVKIDCTEEAFSLMFEKSFTVSGVQAASEVADQPIGLEVTLLGAQNRVKNAKTIFPEADYWVGIEGGLSEDSLGMFAFAWVCIEDKNGKKGTAQTGTFYLPEPIVKLVKSGMELGQADDEFFKDNNSKQKGGSVGILTKGKVTRSEYYSEAIKLALIPIINQNLYN